MISIGRWINSRRSPASSKGHDDGRKRLDEHRTWGERYDVITGQCLFSDVPAPAFCGHLRDQSMDGSCRLGAKCVDVLGTIARRMGPLTRITARSWGRDRVVAPASRNARPGVHG